MVLNEILIDVNRKVRVPQVQQILKMGQEKVKQILDIKESRSSLKWW